MLQPTEQQQLQCDASEKGLRAVLMQNQQLMAFASRALTDTGGGCAQIEKELLLCSLDRRWLDHKPLEVIMKPLLSAPKQLQPMLLRLQGYDVSIRYCPGKPLPVADTYLPEYATRGSEEQETESMCYNTSVSPKEVSTQHVRVQNGMDGYRL